MDAWGWAELGELVTSFGFGVLSAIVPLANAESYVVVSGVSSIGHATTVVAGVALGQTLGKVLLFLGVRRGKQFPFIRRERARLRHKPVGPARRRFRAAVSTLLRLVGEKRWGLPIVLLAAVTGFHPCTRSPCWPARHGCGSAGSRRRCWWGAPSASCSSPAGSPSSTPEPAEGCL